MVKEIFSRIKANGTKSMHVTFTICKEKYSLVILNSLSILQAEGVEYLELHLDHRLNWKRHIF